MKLDENFTVMPDAFNCFALVHSKTEDKLVKGEMKSVTKKETYYYPKMSQVIQRYFKLSLNELEDSTKLIETLERIEKVIENIKNK